MSSSRERLQALRTCLAHDGLDGFIIPLSDEHMSEYVGDYAQRLAWLTGFTGSAGCAVVLRDKAAIFVDGRYSLQVRDQADASLYAFDDLSMARIGGWIAEHAGQDQVIGYDPWLHTRPWLRAVSSAAQAPGGRAKVTLKAVGENPVDLIWADRPLPSDAPIRPHDLAYAGRTSADKRATIATELKRQGADMCILTALDSIAWLFNIRGADVLHTPVVRAFALLYADGTGILFVDPRKLTPDVQAHLGDDVTLRPYDAFPATLRGLSGLVAIDQQSAAAAIFDCLVDGKATPLALRDPCVLPKAIKNDVEMAGARAAHIRDGVALTRFLHWFDETVAHSDRGDLDEMTAGARLAAFRRESDMLQDLSFASITGSGPNGAIIHYHATPETNRPIDQNNMFLVDSGGQYLDGTTDVTRTLPVGTPSDEMRQRFTYVLKGHIALARLVFPRGVRGGQIDGFARQFLWAAGLDYAHGTGHGVGSYLAVHENPPRISPNGLGEELIPGMILSNEPGYYKADAYGVRIENLMLVVLVDMPGAERDMLGFETLTMAPIDRRLIDLSLLDSHEIAWLDAYHARVWASLSALLPDAARAWAQKATCPLGSA